MLYKVLSPDSLHDHSSNDSGIDDCYRRSNRSPLAEEVPTSTGVCSQPSPSSHPLGDSELRLLEHNDIATEGANESLKDSKNRRNTQCQKKYLGVRVRWPVRDLLRTYRIARGKDPSDVQLDKAWKSNNCKWLRDIYFCKMSFNVSDIVPNMFIGGFIAVRRRVVRETVQGHPYATKRNKQIEKTNAFPARNFEEILEDLVEVLETDLKQAKTRSYQTEQNMPGMGCQLGYYTGCPISFWDSLNGSQQLQADQGASDYFPYHFSKDDATLPGLVSVHPEPYSRLEEGPWNLSPAHLAAFTDERDGCQPCYSQNVTGQSLPCSPSSEAESFSQGELNSLQNCTYSHIESKHLPGPAQQQHSLDDSALSFFQFQLRHVEDSLCTVSTQELLCVDKNGDTMLHNAVIQGKRALVYSLACRMANMGRLDAKNIRDRTALHLAAERNQHLMVNDLISLGAQINEKDYLGKTPVHLCAENGFLRVLHVIEKTLMDGTDVDIDAVDNNFLTPLHCMVLAHAATVKEFESSDMNCDTRRFLTLRKEQLLDGMRCLLRMGSSLCMQDLNGRNAIDFAEEVNDAEVLNFLYGYVDRMKTTNHEEFSPFGVFDVMGQNTELTDLHPCGIFLQPRGAQQETQHRLSVRRSKN
ncbi:uncharacterized protein LOC144480000 [Mustelus asterias]